MPPPLKSPIAEISFSLLIIGHQLTYYTPPGTFVRLIEFRHQSILILILPFMDYQPDHFVRLIEVLCEDQITFSKDQIPKWVKNGLTREMKFQGVVTPLYSKPKYPLLAAILLPSLSAGLSFPYVCVVFPPC